MVPVAPMPGLFSMVPNLDDRFQPLTVVQQFQHRAGTQRIRSSPREVHAAHRQRQRGRDQGNYF